MLIKEDYKRLMLRELWFL